MKIQHLKIKNMFGIGHFDEQINNPIALFCGPNASGKSSIQNAVRMALTGSPSRVKLKKDWKQMVTEGQKAGSVEVQAAEGDALSMIGEYFAVLPKGEMGNHESEVLPLILEPSSFSEMKPDERRKFLFTISGLSASVEHIREQLEARNCDMDRAEQLIPLRRAGFTAMHDQAKKNATEAKADWKAVTGEQWGSQKAEDYEAPKVEFDPIEFDSINNDLQRSQSEAARLSEKKGQHKQMIADRDRFLQKRADLKEVADTLTRKQAHYDSAKKTYEDQLEKVENLKVMAGKKEANTLSCPCCDVVLVLEDGALVEHQQQEFNAQAAKMLAEHEVALGVCDRGMKNALELLNKAKEADAALSALFIPAVPEQKLIDDNEKALQKEQEKCSELGKRYEAAAQLKAKAQQASVAQQKADNAHKAVLAWLDLAEALSPSGIPGDLLKEAMNPFNERLEQSSLDTQWNKVALSDDMEITANGRPYYLLSESEKWRADAMISEAISFISGTKLLCLDRFDVIEPKDRGTLIKWLRILAQEKEIDTALIFATMKAPPAAKDGLQVFWLEDGEVKKDQENKAA